jgi:hypothetical protein
MIRNVTALLAGFIFALGLAFSGMTSPANITGFLDVFGNWDPSLLVVLGSAVLTYFVAFRLIMRRRQPVLGGKFQVPAKTTLDGRLIAGAAIFGFGWGLSGYCPAPALTSVASGNLAPLMFLVAMFGGFFAYDLFEKWRPVVINMRKNRSELRNSHNPSSF